MMLLFTCGVKCDPKPGAIAISSRDNSKTLGHVYGVERIEEVGNVICIGGNQHQQPLAVGSIDNERIARPREPLKVVIGGIGD